MSEVTEPLNVELGSKARGDGCAVHFSQPNSEEVNSQERRLTDPTGHMAMSG